MIIIGSRPAVKLKRFKKILLSNPTRTPTDVAFEVYDCKDRDVARVIASQNLSKLNITFQDLMEKAGITDEDDARLLKELRGATKVISANVFNADGEEMADAHGTTKDFIEVPDNHIRYKTLELTRRLKGDLKSNGNGNGVTITNVQINIRPESGLFSETEAETLSRKRSEV